MVRIMKKIISLLMALLILSGALSVPVFAANAPKVVISPQKLTVDGKSVDCEKYNIDGSNYFKLRDMAALLDGTAAGFDISFDADNRAVYIIKGGAYSPVGGELNSGEDKSASCVPSTWKLFVNGVTVAVSTYNIGGSNFYKLRDMGSAIGFIVDFDLKSNTAMIFSDKSQVPASSSQAFFAEEKGFRLSAPAAHIPSVTYYTGDYKFISADPATVTAPVITRSAPTNGNVTYRISYTYKTSSYYDKYSMVNDKGGLSYHLYNVYDYYSGLEFPIADTIGDGNWQYNTSLSWQGTSYPIEYKTSVTTVENRSITSGSTLNWIFVVNSITEITVPENYDGIVIGIECNEVEIIPSYLPDYNVVNDDSSYWDDYDNIENWAFIRISDWAKNA